MVRASSAPERVERLATISDIRETGPETTDITETLKSARPDIIFHLAATYIPGAGPADISALATGNIELTARLCEAACAAGCATIVSAGTAWQNAASPPGDDTPAPNAVYAVTKQAADELIDHYVRAAGLRAVTLNIYDSYGPEDPRRKFLTVLAEAAAEGETLRGTPGDQRLHMVHVDDIVDGFVHAANLLVSKDVGSRDSFTLPSAKSVTLRTLAETWQNATHTSLNIEWGALPERPGDVVTPWDRTPLPGWTPRINLEDGLRSLSA